MQVALLRTGLIAAAVLVATASAGPQPPNDPIANLIEAREQLPATPKPPASQPTGAFATYVDGLRKASCPAGVSREEPRTVPLAYSVVSLQGINPGRKSVGALSFVGGFHITTTDTGFGGWSGLDMLDDGRLLAVSDDGRFLWIDLAADGLTPTGLHMSEMRDTNGKPFPTKIAGDAEGLAIYNGLAIVSFEGDPRVMAYDVTTCGAAARAAPVGWSLKTAFANSGLKVDPNAGVEGLAITDDGFLIAGVEKQAKGESPLSIRPLEAIPEFNFRIGAKSPELVGLDQVSQGDDVRLFSLHRSSSAPLSSNAITVIETVLTRDKTTSGRAGQAFSIKSSLILAQMNILLTIDNYEGIAARRMPDGRVRLYIISDDNFSGRQRTLLMTFDVLSK